MDRHLLTLTFPSYTNDATHKSVDLQVASRQACRCGRRRPPEEGRQEHPFLPAEEGMSQEAFAEVLGVHRTYMGGLERGERNLTLRSLERIAEQMGVEVEELMR